MPQEDKKGVWELGGQNRAQWKDKAQKYITQICAIFTHSMHFSTTGW